MLKDFFLNLKMRSGKKYHRFSLSPFPILYRAIGSVFNFLGFIVENRKASLLENEQRVIETSRNSSRPQWMGYADRHQPEIPRYDSVGISR